MVDIVRKIREGELDPNNVELFFSKLLKAVLWDMANKVVVKSGPIPHIIYNTGDDIMWLLEKDYNYSKEPQDNTNEQYIYSRIPRCAAQPTSIDVQPDQLTSPYVMGQFQVEEEGKLYTLLAEQRRMPIKTQLELKYVLNSFTEALELIQVILSKLVFLQTVKFSYMGQTILASYKIPEGMQEEHQVDIDGATTEDKDRKVNLTIEIESTMPVYEPRTTIEAIPITNPINKMSINGNEVDKRDNASRKGRRSS